MCASVYTLIHRYGQVTGNSAAEEEIAMITSPEAMAGMMLFDAALGDTDAALVLGARRCIRSTGYQHCFRFEGRDAEGWAGALLAIDASIGLADEQYRQPNVARDVHKALAGFSACSRLLGEGVAVASGRWGVGWNSGGDASLKFLQQLLAARHASVRLLYYLPADANAEAKWACAVLAAIQSTAGHAGGGKADGDGQLAATARLHGAAATISRLWSVMISKPPEIEFGPFVMMQLRPPALKRRSLAAAATPVHLAPAGGDRGIAQAAGEMN